MVRLGWASGLDIVQHRRSAGRTLLGEEAAVKVYQPSRRRVAFGGRDPGTFVERRSDKGGSRGCRSNLAGTGSSQHGDRRSTGKAAEFCPHLRNDVVADRGRNPTGYESAGDLLAPGRAVTGQFADRGLPGFPDARHQDVALRRQHHRKEGHAAEHPSHAEALAQHGDVVDPVQHRQHSAVRTERWREIIDRGLETVGLARNKHHVVGAADSAGEYGLDRRSVLAVGHFDDEPPLGELRRSPRPDQKGNIGAAPQQHSAVIATERPRADDQKPHDSLPGLSGFCGPGEASPSGPPDIGGTLCPTSRMRHAHAAPTVRRPKPDVIARSDATKQSRQDCFASLAMTGT